MDESQKRKMWSKRCNVLESEGTTQGTQISAERPVPKQVSLTGRAAVCTRSHSARVQEASSSTAAGTGTGTDGPSIILSCCKGRGNHRRSFYREIDPAGGKNKVEKEQRTSCK